jgi:hypothetical protein
MCVCAACACVEGGQDGADRSVLGETLGQLNVIQEGAMVWQRTATSACSFLGEHLARRSADRPLAPPVKD